MLQRAISLFLCLSCLFVVTPANETDQYNLPPKPLADIAPEVEAYVAQKIQTAVDKLNEQITTHERCFHPLPSAAFGTREGSNVTIEAPPRKPASCGTDKNEEAILARLRSPDAVARAVYEQLGTGNIFITNTGKWLNTHKFEHEPSRYTQPYLESIYWERPINYATLSPTIRMYGVEFGTDKLDHLFQQGYTYYRKYTAARKEGKSEADALKVPVAWGRSTENLFFGYAVSGVYSNADLAANLAGLRFYQNLASEIQIGDHPIGPKATLVDGHWRPTEVYFTKPPSDRTIYPIPLSILAPFISSHLNEAYNPSNYLPLLYPIVRTAVKKHACSEWHAAFPTLTALDLTTRTAALTTWNGLDYGYKQTSRQVRLADTCFTQSKGPVTKE